MQLLHRLRLSSVLQNRQHGEPLATRALIAGKPVTLGCLHTSIARTASSSEVEY
jgi:hypothetical protein